MEKNEILKELEELGSPLAGLSRTMPYAVPEGYFEDLPLAARAAIHQEDAAMSVPVGYFHTLPQAMLKAAKASQARAEKSARVIELPMRRWAAAAVLLVSIGIGGLLLFNGTSAGSGNLAADLPLDAVEEYAETNFPAPDIINRTIVSNTVQPDLTDLTTEDLQAYLDEAGWPEEPTL